MDESDTIITLIGTRLAKIGNEFVFRSAAKECQPCKFNKTCLSLNPGSRYKIVKIRNPAKLECSVHDSGVFAVEVIEAPIRMAVESRKAIKGSKIVFEVPPCSYQDCENYTLCRPSGLRTGDKFSIVEVIDDIIEPCRKGYSMKIVEVKR